MARVALEINVQREWRERVEIVVRLFTVLFLYIFFNTKTSVVKSSKASSD